MKLVSLERWLRDTYGEDAPHMETARRWARAGKIQPPPQKHGRAYFVHPEARYTNSSSAKPRLVDRLRAENTLPS